MDISDAPVHYDARQAEAWVAGRESVSDRLEQLEALADAVRAGLMGLPDHPWIPGASARPVRDALLALDGALPTRDGSVPIG